LASAKYARGQAGRSTRIPGSTYVYSQIADISYNRLTRTVDLTGQTSGSLSFWISRDTEQDWDHVFVEATRLGKKNWTTLPDLNGHTTTATGLSCPAGWRDYTPSLDHYADPPMPRNMLAYGHDPASGTLASADRTVGKQWSVDLSAYAGQQVEVSTAYVSD